MKMKKVAFGENWNVNLEKIPMFFVTGRNLL